MKTYGIACKTPSDINEHLPILYRYSSECQHITEFGLGRTSNAIRAFLAAKPEFGVVSYDIDSMPEVVKDVQKYADSLKVDWTFILGSTTDEDTHIDETDFLFIDAKHSYYSVNRELQGHQHKVKKYIGFHDVVSYASRNEDPKQTGPDFIEGIVPAIFQFLVKYPSWKVDYYSPYNNGLLILKRV